MNADLLLELHDRVADGRDAIPRLRRFVLDLAVRGKLVEQDASDEPATELLKRIAKEKARLVKAGEIKKGEVEPLQQDDALWPIPANWAWTRLGSVGDWGSGSTPSRGTSEYYGGTMTWLKSGELNDNMALSGSEERVTELALKQCSFRLNKPGDVLIAMYGATIGKLAILAEHAVTNQAVCGCTPFTGVQNRYLFLHLLSQRANFHAASEGGAQPNISKVKIVTTLFPLPPLAEQQRIVAKVDELMALLDRLEQARAGREALRDQLTAATLNRLTQTDPEDFQPAAHFALQTLPHLTTRPDQIKTLRQTILNLAVRGKLVEQDAADEPASELLKRIAGKKSAMPTVGVEPFEVAPSWIWVDFEAVAAFENGDRGKNYPNRNEYKDVGVPWINTGHIRPDGSLSAATMHFISREKFNSLGGGKIRPGDMLYCLRGATFGKTAFVEPYEEGAIASSLMIIRPSKAADRRFTYFYLTSPFGRSQLLRFDNGTAQPNLSSGNVKRYRFPLPPLAEQHRIVARVDALMALCDQLEAGLAGAEATRSRLLDALLHAALQPAPDLAEAAE